MLRLTLDQRDLLHHDDNVVDFDGLQSAVVTGKQQERMLANVLHAIKSKTIVKHEYVV